MRLLWARDLAIFNRVTFETLRANKKRLCVLANKRATTVWFHDLALHAFIL